jgi:Ca-activated chloride channel family protein
MIGIAGRDTAIGDAIGLALKRHQQAEGDTVLVLLTDGANTAGRVLPQKAAELAAQENMRIHTIGVGGKARILSSWFGRQQMNPARDLDEPTLKAIAALTGGEYFRATDRESLEAIYKELDQLEPVVSGNQVVRPVDELYYWPLGAAFLLSLVLALLAASRGLRK